MSTVKLNWSSLFVLFLALSVGPSRGEVIYSESFSTGANTSVSTFGWSAYNATGTDLSSYSDNPLFVYDGVPDFVFIGNASSGGAYALISAAPAINPTGYQNDLQISFVHRVLDDPPSSAGQMGWRLLAEVGGTWYASDLVSSSASFETRSSTISDVIWRSWETSLTDGFNLSGISGTAANLPSGNITRSGILAIDGDDFNDRMQFHSFAITGTVIPEPATFGLLGVAGLAMLLHRRRAKREALGAGCWVLGARC